MKSDTDLDLVFKNAVGKKVILNIEEPKSGVTKAEIDAAMQTVVDNNRAELVFIGAHGKQAGGPHRGHRRTELQYCRNAGRNTQTVTGDAGKPAFPNIY